MFSKKSTMPFQKTKIGPKNIKETLAGKVTYYSAIAFIIVSTLEGATNILIGLLTLSEYINQGITPDIYVFLVIFLPVFYEVPKILIIWLIRRQINTHYKIFNVLTLGENLLTPIYYLNILFIHDSIETWDYSLYFPISLILITKAVFVTSICPSMIWKICTTIPPIAIFWFNSVFIYGQKSWDFFDKIKIFTMLLLGVSIYTAFIVLHHGNLRMIITNCAELNGVSQSFKKIFSEFPIGIAVIDPDMELKFSNEKIMTSVNVKTSEDFIEKIKNMSNLKVKSQTHQTGEHGLSEVGSYSFHELWNAVQESSKRRNFGGGKNQAKNPKICFSYYEKEKKIENQSQAPQKGSTFVKRKITRRRSEGCLENVLASGSKGASRDQLTNFIMYNMRFKKSNLFVLITNDILEDSELRKIQRQSEGKTLLMSSISHEVRTPLNSIFSHLSTLSEDHSINESLKLKCIHPAISSSMILLSTIDDITDYLDSMNKKFVLKKTWFNLRAVIQETVNTFRILIQEKKIDLSLKIEHRIAVSWFGDPKRLSQILMNLLSNSYKFTFKGRIDVIVQRVTESMIQISVQDTGIGMSPKTLKRLEKLLSSDHGVAFNDFQKVTSHSSGASLGLVISKMLLESMNGMDSEINRFKVYSTKNQGTEVMFCLKGVSIKDKNLKYRRSISSASRYFLKNSIEEEEPEEEEKKNSKDEVLTFSMVLKPKVDTSFQIIENNLSWDRISERKSGEEEDKNGVQTTMNTTRMNRARKTMSGQKGQSSIQRKSFLDNNRFGSNLSESFIMEEPLESPHEAFGMTISPNDNEEVEGHSNPMPKFTTNFQSGKKPNFLKTKMSSLQFKCSAESIIKPSQAAGGDQKDSEIYLIIDDDVFNLQIIEKQLKMALGKELFVEKAYNGQEAIGILTKLSKKDHHKRVAVIFCDINMPVMGGYTTNRKIKELYSKLGTKTPPVVACTAYVNGDERKKIEREFDLFISKPINAKAFKEVLELAQKSRTKSVSNESS